LLYEGRCQKDEVVTSKVVSLQRLYGRKCDRVCFVRLLFF
jgi:hypothetical protein